MSFIITISGAAHSGKSTCIETLKKHFGDYIVDYSELIRNKKINIDEIRKDPVKYLDFEIEVITEKIEQEEKAIYEGNKIVLFDRSLIDSYFYYTFYTDKAQFDEIDLKKYHEFLAFLTRKTYEHSNDLYNTTFLFKPIVELKRQDEFTQQYLKYTQENEYNFIKNMTYGFMIKKYYKIVEIDVVEEYDRIHNIIEVKISQWK